MKEILIPLNFTTTPVLYDTKQSFSSSDEESGVLTFTTTADVTDTVASLTIRNASENANRQTVLIERLDVNSSPFSYAVKMPLPFGNYEGGLLLKKNLTVLASASFLFGVNSSLSAEVLPKLVEAYSLDNLVEEVETEVSNLKDAYTVTVSETIKGVNKTESTLQLSENVRYLNEATRKANELLRISNENARIAAEVERKDTFDTLVDSAVIEETVAQEVANEFQQIESTYANRLISTEQQLAHITSKEINALYPPSPMVGCKGDGISDDTSALKIIINAAKANGFNKVYLPPTDAGYALNGRVDLQSGIEIFGNKTKIITTSKAVESGVFFGTALTNISVKSFRFCSVNDKTRGSGRNGLSSHVIGIHLSGCAGIECSDLFGDQLEYMIKVDSNSSDVKIRNIKTTNTHQSIYIGASTDLFLDALNLGCPTEANTDSLDHALYLANVTNVQVGQITCKQGKGYAIHIFYLPESPSKNLNFKNVILNNVRAGIVAYSAKGINFGNVVIDGINSSSGSASAITCSLDSELFVSNLKISNIGNLRGGALFSVSAPTSGILKILGGIVDNAGTNVIAQMETNGDLSIDNVLFNLCEGRIASSITSAHRYLFVKNCTFIRNSTPATTPPSTEQFRLQGTLFAEIEGNTFLNAQSNGRAIIYCTDNTGMVAAKNNTIKGDSLLISPSDTKTKGSNNFDANNNRVDSAVQFRNTAAGEGLVLKTPDGTKLYKISVGNDGIVTTTLTS